MGLGVRDRGMYGELAAEVVVWPAGCEDSW